MNMTTLFIDDTMRHIYHEIWENYMPTLFKGFEYTPWVFSLMGSALIGLSGILPLFVIPIDTIDTKAGNSRKFFFGNLRKFFFTSLYIPYVWKFLLFHF